MKKYIAVFIILCGLTSFAQKELNYYKYVVIPSKFEFQKSEDQYGINTLLKFKFEQLGFKTYLESDELSGLNKIDPCQILKPYVLNQSSMFTVKLKVQVKDCYNQEVFSTQLGTSKSKNYRTAYTEALRNALKSFDNYTYEYSNKEETISKNVLNTEKVEKSKHVLSSKKEVREGFVYKIEDIKYLLKKTVMGYKIIEVASNNLKGVMFSSYKEDIYHINLNDKKGIAYFDEDESLILEFLSDNNTLQITKTSKEN